MESFSKELRDRRIKMQNSKDDLTVESEGQPGNQSLPTPQQQTKRGLIALNTWRGVLVASMILILFFIIEGTILDYTGTFDVCVMDRFDKNSHSSSFLHSRPLSLLVFYTTELSVLSIFIFISIWSPASRTKTTTTNAPSRRMRVQVNWDSLFVVSYTSLWYCSTYAICYALKEVLKDYNCSRKPNSVSGHFCFHIFYLLSVLYLMVRLNRNPQRLHHYIWSHNGRSLTFLKKKLRPSTRVLLSVFALLVVTTSFTLTQTYFYGYHTPRQILYGVLLAVISHTCLTVVFEEGPSMEKNMVLYILSGLLLVSFSFVYLMTATIPFSTFELGFMVFVLCLALYSYLVPLKSTMRDALTVQSSELNQSIEKST